MGLQLSGSIWFGNSYDRGSFPSIEKVVDSKEDIEYFFECQDHVFLEESAGRISHKFFASGSFFGNFYMILLTMAGKVNDLDISGIENNFSVVKETSGRAGLGFRMKFSAMVSARS